MVNIKKCSMCYRAVYNSRMCMQWKFEKSFGKYNIVVYIWWNATAEYKCESWREILWITFISSTSSAVTSATVGRGGVWVGGVWCERCAEVDCPRIGNHPQAMIVLAKKKYQMVHTVYTFNRTLIKIKEVPIFGLCAWSLQLHI